MKPILLICLVRTFDTECQKQTLLQKLHCINKCQIWSHTENLGLLENVRQAYFKPQISPGLYVHLKPLLDIFFS